MSYYGGWKSATITVSTDASLSAAVGFGYGISVKLSNDAHEVEERASIDFILNVATNGVEYAVMNLNLIANGTMTNPLQFNTDGILFAMSGKAIGAPNGADGDYLIGTARDSDTDTESAALKLTITGGADQIPSAGKVYVEVIYLDSANLADV